MTADSNNLIICFIGDIFIFVAGALLEIKEYLLRCYSALVVCLMHLRRRMVEVVGLSFAALKLIIDIIVRSMLGVQVDDALVPFDLSKLVRIIVRIVASSD